MRAGGLCIGASNISFVELAEEDHKIVVLKSRSLAHEGNPREVISRLLAGGLFAEVDYLGVTGRKYRNIINAAIVSEPEAMEEGYRFLDGEGYHADAIISVGGETFMVYTLGADGRINRMITGNKCASGTGDFFLQQLKRLGLSLESALEAGAATEPYEVSGRCSVFCKSDCTHALNKGAPKGAIVAGLCRMMSDKILELLQGTTFARAFLIGGVAQNHVMLNFLKEKLPGIVVPPHAHAFEALGAALWALQGKKEKPGLQNLLSDKGQLSFSSLPAPAEQLNRVHFAKMAAATPQPGDSCILGLDVGSTTTKAVLMRQKDKAMLAGCYLRTQGDPVAAARECYRQIDGQVGGEVKIIALGVTGSGRQIAALHALTPAVINEIIAHATAAVHFDPMVDTIFEIGGQDAKYTFLSGGVPSDYAMNEACSAGTGSFLEEAAGESLGVKVEDIGSLALKSRQPLNFSDQCAAFINSDIKTAIQEGCGLEDIAAGLVYSVCQNYNNRVKGNREVGSKVFMQGGVCYNEAVPAAMAALTGKEIIVPPNPGLMGAYGVALEVEKRLELGLLKPQEFDLTELAGREAEGKEPFQCGGGPEGCDRRCRISRLSLKGRVYPFGGACNRYANLTGEGRNKGVALDLVRRREQLVYEKYSRDYGRPSLPSRGVQVGISTSLMTSTLYPLYYNFFASLGFEVILAEKAKEEGLHKKGAAYCYPVELAHGFAAALLAAKPPVIFMPHVKSLPMAKGDGPGVTCPFVQGEPYYLKGAFPELAESIFISPVLEMESGYAGAREAFLDVGRQLGVRREEASQAFATALAAQESFHKECRRLGRDFLEQLAKEGRQKAVVLFGRPYNAFAKAVNMAIPGKFSSRDCPIIPYDFLPLEEEENMAGMYWASGQNILKAARYVAKHPLLYGVYITNFSCGPDSFISGYFRDIMGQKPSLTLELDSHTADAGLDTRIEALLDVVQNYIEINRQKALALAEKPFQAARTFSNEKGLWVEDSSGEIFSLRDARAQVLVPAMGLWGARFLAASFRRQGVAARALPPAGEKEFKRGQGLSSCKECLPYILTLGSLLVAAEKAPDGGTLIYFMPETAGPCRFGQYNVRMKEVVRKENLKNTAFLSLTSTNGYAGFGSKMALRAWQAVIINDVMEEIYSAILTLARDREAALKTYHEVGHSFVAAIEAHSWRGLKRVLRQGAAKLRAIPCKNSRHETPTIALVGEIFVRQDQFSLKNLVERMAERGIMVRTAPVAEWLYYCDYLVQQGLVAGSGQPGPSRLYRGLQNLAKRHFEKEIKKIFADGGLYHEHLVDVEQIIKKGERLISPRLTGEAILTIGSALAEAGQVFGAISIGPFGCMPGRMAEALLARAIEDMQKNGGPPLPFLAVETDGNQFTLVVEARLDAFCLQVKRAHKKSESLRLLDRI